MSLKQYVKNTEEEIRALKEQNEILRSTVHCLQVRIQLQEATLQYYIRERATEETRRIHAELRLDLANLELLEVEQDKNLANALAEDAEEVDQDEPEPLEVVVEEEENETEDEDSADSGNEFDVPSDENSIDDVNLGQAAVEKDKS